MHILPTNAYIEFDELNDRGPEQTLFVKVNNRDTWTIVAWRAGGMRTGVGIRAFDCDIAASGSDLLVGVTNAFDGSAQYLTGAVDVLSSITVTWCLTGQPGVGGGSTVISGTDMLGATIPVAASGTYDVAVVPAWAHSDGVFNGSDPNKTETGIQITV